MFCALLYASHCAPLRACACSPCATFIDPTVHAKSRWEAALAFFYPIQHLFSRVDVSGISAPQLELVPQRQGPPLLQVGGMLLVSWLADQARLRIDGICMEISRHVWDGAHSSPYASCTKVPP